MNSIAEFMKPTAARLWTPIVSIPKTADYKTSKRQKVLPDLLSISNEIYSFLHMWNSVL